MIPENTDIIDIKEETNDLLLTLVWKRHIQLDLII